MHENVPTELVKGVKDYIVDSASASPQLPGVRFYGIEANHSQMCKFESRKAPGFLNVATQVRKWVTESQPLIASRFIAERQKRQQDKQNEARELLGYLNFQAQDTVTGPGGSAAMTPGMSANAGQRPLNMQSPAKIESSRPMQPSVFEVSEVEEQGVEMAKR